MLEVQHGRQTPIEIWPIVVEWYMTSAADHRRWMEWMAAPWKKKME